MLFLFGEAVLVTLILTYRSIKFIENRIETSRLMSSEELRKYYESQASKSSPFSEAYKLLLEKTSPPKYHWVPGLVEKFSEELYY